MPCGLALTRRRRQTGRPGDPAQALPRAHHHCAACGRCRMSLGVHLQGLRARFDLLALRPPAASPSPAGDTLARQQPAWAGLQAWCRHGAGPGCSAWAQPGAQPAVAQRLAVAALRGPDDATTRTWAETLARQLDGSVALAALPGGATGTAALVLRLRTKGQDALWWRPRQPDDPWDAGWAIDTPRARAHWPSGFMPRRATLVLADRREAAPLHLQLHLYLAALAARSDDFRHPVRWLWVGGDDDIAAVHGLAVARFVLARR